MVKPDAWKTTWVLIIVLAGMATTVLAQNHSNMTRKPSSKLHFVQYPGSSETYLLGVSNNDIGVGWYGGSDGKQHGFIVENGKYTTVDDPSGVGTALFGVNSSGIAVGFYSTGVGVNSQAFSYANGVFTNIGPVGASSSAALGINDLGEIVGNFVDVDGVTKGWIFNNTSYETVTVASSINTAVWDINIYGMATVVWVDASGLTHSDIYDGATFTNIDVPDAANSYAYGIDSAGDVVFGWEKTRSSNVHSAALISGKYTKFDVPGCTQSSATKTNDHRTIVGFCQPATTTQGFYVIY